MLWDMLPLGNNQLEGDYKNSTLSYIHAPPLLFLLTSSELWIYKRGLSSPMTTWQILVIISEQ